MTFRRQEVFYRRMIEDEGGEITLDSEENVREGYFERWGQMTHILPPQEYGNPEIVNVMTVAIIVDRTTGKVNISKPNHVTFKKHYGSNLSYPGDDQRNSG